MTPVDLLLAILATWFGIVLLGYAIVLPVLRRGPGGEAMNGVLWVIVKVYARFMHRVRGDGAEELRGRPFPGRLVVISNHTGAVDPLLIQSLCRFHVRWLMAADLMYPSLAELWKQQGIIAVARDGTDIGPAREAIRHVRDGGAIGIFPEGRIVTPPRQVWPFQAGAGLVIARSKAPVMLAWVSGTPSTNDVAKSLFTRSRARVHFEGPIDYSHLQDPVAITEDLRRRIEKASGWPRYDGELPPATRGVKLEMG
ncbi:MAG: lysophospholipid acyltransferase family protein [Planctomycetota bacterium]|jgi:1-acyl-sn-glycerol-3-phosphate acyltransferase